MFFADPAHLVNYRALYDFTARNPDELTINAEDIIVVNIKSFMLSMQYLIIAQVIPLIVSFHL